MWDNSFYIILDGRQDVNKGAEKRPHRPLVFASCGREGSRTPSEQAHRQIRPIELLLPESQIPLRHFKRTMIINLHQQHRGHALLDRGVVTEGFPQAMWRDRSGDMEEFRCAVDDTPRLDATDGPSIFPVAGEDEGAVGTANLENYIMEKHIYDEKNGLWYELQGNYFVPCLKLPAEEQRPIGAWGSASSAVSPATPQGTVHRAADHRQAERLSCRSERTG